VPTELTGIPETALITLRNRATEAARPDAVLSDPQAVALLERVGGTERYATFSNGDQAIALRARIFDDITRRFLTEHPGATVVALGEGLQTSFWRVADPRTAQFRSWAQAIARRRGKKVAMVALARRLARTLFAMWRDQTDYRPERIRARRPTLGTEVTADISIAASL